MREIFIQIPLIKFYFEALFSRLEYKEVAPSYQLIRKNKQQNGIDMIPAGYRNFNSEHVPGKTKLLEFIYGLRRYTFSVTNQVVLFLLRYIPNKLLLIYETIFCYNVYVLHLKMFSIFFHHCSRNRNLNPTYKCSIHWHNLMYCDCQIEYFKHFIGQ